MYKNFSKRLEALKADPGMNVAIAELHQRFYYQHPVTWHWSDIPKSGQVYRGDRFDDYCKIYCVTDGPLPMREPKGDPMLSQIYTQSMEPLVLVHFEEEGWSFVRDAINGTGVISIRYVLAAMKRDGSGAVWAMPLDEFLGADDSGNSYFERVEDGLLGRVVSDPIDRNIV